MASVRDVGQLRPPRGDERVHLPDVFFHQRQEVRLCSDARGRDMRFLDDIRVGPGLGQRRLEPGQVHVLAGNDVLIGVVEFVVSHEPRHGHVPLAHRQLVPVERP